MKFDFDLTDCAEDSDAVELVKQRLNEMEDEWIRFNFFEKMLAKQTWIEWFNNCPPAGFEEAVKKAEDACRVVSQTIEHCLKDKALKQYCAKKLFEFEERIINSIRQYPELIKKRNWVL
jgi:hypothetical protein